VLIRALPYRPVASELWAEISPLGLAESCEIRFLTL
jgi:hypothetical protein